jgi:hypothetical protein
MRPRREAVRRPGLRTWALRGALLLIVFAVGLALGQALDDSAPPTGTRTSVRTLAPGTLNPETITVTVGTVP